MFPEINYFKQFPRKNFFYYVFTRLKTKDEEYMQVACKENLSSCAPS